MSFYLSWLRSTPDTSRYRQWLQGIRTHKLNTLLGIGTFDITGLPWIGASYVATEFWGSLSGRFSIRRPQINPADYNFFLAIRTPQRNNTGLDVTRYKLWEPLENERLDTFPVYREERIESAFAIEVWTIPSSDRVSLDEVEYLITSLIVDPVTCCCDADPVIMLEEVCGIWAPQNELGSYDLPIVFDTCFNAIPDAPTDTYYRRTENTVAGVDEIRKNENDDLRVYV